MRHAWVLVATLAMAGCDNQYQYSGFQMSDFFTLNGDVVGWTFGNTDATVNHLLVRTLDPEPVINADEQAVYTWSVDAECVESAPDCGVEGFQYAIQMSVDDRRGVQIHGYERPDTGLVEFDSPIELADVRMARGDTVDSLGVDGYDFTTTYVQNEDCEQTLQVSWDCARIELTSEPAGHWLTGVYWATPGYNIVAFQREGDVGKWRVIRNPVVGTD